MNAEAEEIEPNPDELFKAVLDCEAELSEAKAELQKATTLFGQRVNGCEKKLADAWKEVEDYMTSTGEYELSFPAPAGQAYIVNYSTPRQSVKITDDDAVPDELCRIKREPDKKKIKEELENGKAFNWASLQYGEKHLQWRCVKMKGQNNDK